MSGPTHSLLQVVRVDVDRNGSTKADPYVYIKLGDKSRIVHRTGHIQHDGTPASNATIPIPHLDTSIVLHVSLKEPSKFTSDRSIGHIDISASELLQETTGEDFVRHLSSRDRFKSGRSSQDTVGTVTLCIKDVDALSLAETFVEIAERGSKRIGTSVDDATAKIDIIIQTLDQIFGIVEKVAEIHPLISVSWKATTALYNLVSHQIKADSKLRELVKVMRDAFDFSSKADRLNEKTGELKPAVKELLGVTVECSRFVQEYTMDGFLGRMARLSRNAVIDGHIARFVDLKKGLDSLIGLATLAVVIDTESRQLLETVLRPTDVDSSTVARRPRCLAGTREGYLDSIKDALFQETFTGRNAVWLTGAAGSGKSTIAVTIADVCDEMRCPAAYLFFERGKGEYSYVIRNIAYKIATLHPTVAPHIVNAARENMNISGNELDRQFRKLVLEPLQASAGGLKRPVVIILDALDECGAEAQRGELLRLLKDGFAELPPMVRLLATSRPERDIMEFLSSASHTHRIELECTSAKNRADVDIYMRGEMIALVGKEAPDGWMWENIFYELSSGADGLFIWASTAVKMVRNSDDRVEKLESLLSNIRLVGGGIDSLYSAVLEESGISWAEDKSRERFKRILGLVLFAKETLSDVDIAGFLGIEKRKVELTLGRLRSVVSYESGRPIRFHHASFADYILSVERCGSKPWWIDEPEERRLIAETCFCVMKQGLRFNICGIESSFMRNDDVPGIQDRIKTNIPRHLVYVCRFWAAHFCDLSNPTAVLDNLKQFAFEQLLFWFEVLSLTKCSISVAGDSLRKSCGKTAPIDAETSAFLWASYKLSNAFWYPISQSAPHVYLSAVSLWKEESRVADRYSRIYPTVQVHQFGTRRLSPCMKILRAHPGRVESLAFSPDGRRIVSSSDDGTGRIWDTDSGEVVSGPFEGHTGDVLSVAFSPDGRRVASGSSDTTVCIWDADSGNLIAGPFKGHEGIVTSVAFSPDGSRITSGSTDGTLRVWDVQTGEIVSGPFEHGSKVNSVVFSPDRNRIAAGSSDGKVRIWDVDTGQLVLGPFTGHTDEITSVAFSPDGHRVVSGSRDKTVRIWEADTGALVSGPFGGHTGWVWSVAFSPDGERIAAGLGNETVIIWDAESGRVISGPLKGHRDTVTSVAFSPDGRRLASASSDKTIRIWDADCGQLISDPFEWSALTITSVAYSPDATRIASGSDDGKVHVWEVDSGKLVLGPLEGHTEGVYLVAFSPDGRFIASGSSDNTIRIWDADTGKLLLDPLKVQANWTFSFSISPDGRRVAATTEDQSIRVCNVDNGELVSEILRGHRKRIHAVAFSPNGRYLASGSKDKTICIWDANSGELVSGPLEGHEKGVNVVVFSYDSHRVASGSDDKTVRLWDIDASELVAMPCIGHTASIDAVAFSPHGKLVVSGSFDGTIRIWDADSGELVSGPFQAYPWQCTSVAFSRDGGRVLSCFFSDVIRILKIEKDELEAGGAERSLTDKPANPSSSTSINANTNLSNQVVETSKSSRKQRAVSYWTLSVDGWVLGPGGELLTWIPKDMRASLWTARTTSYFHCQFSTRLDLVNSPLGEDWCAGFPLLPE